jgi:hypothetical protein
LYKRKDREKGKEEREKTKERGRSPGVAPPSFPCQWALTAL